MRGPLSIAEELQGAGIRILTPTISSPTLADQMRILLKAYPQAKWHVYEPVNRDNVLEGAKMAFGQPVETHYELRKADVIRLARRRLPLRRIPRLHPLHPRFAKRRNPDAGEMSRLYVVESTPSSTGAKADHRLPVRASEIEAFAAGTWPDLWAVTGEVGMASGEQQKFARSAVAKDLQSHRGSSVVIAGDHQPPAVHALAHAINASLGQCRQDGFLHRPGRRQSGQPDRIAERSGRRHAAGKVDLLIILGGNPAYDAPADLGFADALKSPSIPLRVHLGLYQDETAELCQWHVNEAHYLEAGAMPGPTTAR